MNLRAITNKRKSDHVRISTLLEETGFLSVNQATAYSLLVELWKARLFDVPLLSDLLTGKRCDERTHRSDTLNRVTTTGRDVLALNAEKLWNMSSDRFKRTNLLTVAKEEAKKLAKSLPI